MGAEGAASFARPSWQAGAGVPADTNRLVTEVALAADLNTGGYFILNGQLYMVGGYQVASSEIRTWIFNSTTFSRGAGCLTRT
jgi:subtilase family serine protease